MSATSGNTISCHAMKEMLCWSMGAIPPQTLRNLEPGPDHIAPEYLHLPQWICWRELNLSLALEEDLENFQEVTPKYEAA